MFYYFIIVLNAIISLEYHILENGEHVFVLYIADGVRPSFSVVSNADIFKTQPLSNSDITIVDVGQTSTTQGKNCCFLFLNKHINLIEMLNNSVIRKFSC